MATEQEMRVNAAIGELQAQITALTQRCINLAGELALANSKIQELTPKEEKKD